MKDSARRAMFASFRKGSKVKIASDNDNENYEPFRGKILKISHIAKNREEHPGFDEGMGEPLYDLETKDGEEVPFSLYEYELEKA